MGAAATLRTLKGFHMSPNAKDEVARFLAFLGEYGESPDCGERIARLPVADDIKTLLLARDQAGLTQHLGEGIPIVSFIYIRETVDPR